MGLDTLKYLLDSNIIIYHLNGEKAATGFLKENWNVCSISRISYIEILSFDFPERIEKDVVELLNSFKIIDTSEDIARQCLLNRKLKKIKIPDNIILATAQVFRLILVTRNICDFFSLYDNVLDIFEQK